MSKYSFCVKSVIFDMDGVITNTMPDHFLSWKTVLAREGIHATHEDIYKREGQRGIDSVKEIFAEYQKKFDEDTAHRILRDKEELFKEIVKTRFIKGSRNFLKKLHRMNVRLALVTGTSRHEVHKILPKNIFDLFSIVITSNDVKNGKPHPEPYLTSLQRLEIDSRDAIVIENAPFGISSAKKANIKCLALETSLPRTYLKEADAIFSSIKELEENVNFCSN